MLIAFITALVLTLGLAGMTDYEDRMNNLTDMMPSEAWLQGDM